MTDKTPVALGAAAAFQLADVTKTRPQFGAITPSWTARFLEFKGCGPRSLSTICRKKSTRWRER